MYLQKLLRRRRNGSTLIVAISTLFVTAMLCVAMVAASMSSTRLSGHRRGMTQAFDLAEAGLAHAKQCLNENSSYTGGATTSFGAGTFTVSVSTPAAYPTRRQAHSIGKVVDVSGAVCQRPLTAMFDTVSNPPIFGFSVITKDVMTFSGGAITGSSDTPSWIGVGTQTHKGDIQSNSSSSTAVTLSGTANLDGQVDAVGGIKNSSTGTPVANFHTGVAAVPFPTVDMAAVKASIQSQYGTYGPRTVSGGGTMHVQGLIVGDLTSSGSSTVYFDGPVYVTGKIDLSGSGGFVYNTQNVQIIADGTVNISGSSIVNVTPPWNNALIASNSNNNNALVMSGSVHVVGALYAPNGGVTLSGGAALFGTVAANTFTESSSGTVIRNTTFQAPPFMSNGVSLLFWQER